MRNRFFYLSLLRASLVAGAVYDLILAGGLTLAPQLVGKALRLPLPAQPLYLWLLAILATMLAVLYLVAAEDPRRYSAVVVVAIGGRLAGAAAFALAALRDPTLDGLWTPAVVDLVFGVVHAVAWSRQR
jgi:hypothetical protein